MTPTRMLLYQAALGRLDGLLRLEEKGWWELQAQAAWEGLDGLLYQRCHQVGLGLPAKVERAFQRAYREVAGRNWAALQGLKGILEALAAANLRMLVLPGAALLPLYPDPGCRPMDDIDVLVEPGTGHRVQEVLRGCGLVALPRHEELFVRRDLVLDLHADLLNSGRVRARRLAGWMDPEEVWRDRASSHLEGVAVETMGPEDMVLYTAVHALRHSFGRFTWFIDLRALFQLPLDWERLQEKAGRYHLERPLLYSLLLLRERLGSELPQPAATWVEELAMGAVERRLLEQAFDQGREGEWGDLIWSFNIATLWKRWWFLAETAFPRPAVLLQVFPYLPRMLLPLAYGLRLGQLLGRGARLISGMRRSWR